MIAADCSHRDHSVSDVQIGRAIARTWDIGNGPRYRLSQLFGTRVLTSQSWSAPTTCRPHVACASDRPLLSNGADVLSVRDAPLTVMPCELTSTTSPETATTGLRIGCVPPGHGPGRR